MRKKEERSKHGQTNNNKAKQHSTIKAVALSTVLSTKSVENVHVYTYEVHVDVRNHCCLSGLVDLYCFISLDSPQAAELLYLSSSAHRAHA